MFVTTPKTVKKLIKKLLGVFFFYTPLYIVYILSSIVLYTLTLSLQTCNYKTKKT